MKLNPFRKMRSVEREHIRVHLCGFDASMPEQLAHKLQWPPVQQQMHREAVPKGVTPNLERRLSPQLGGSADRCSH